MFTCNPSNLRLPDTPPAPPVPLSALQAILARKLVLPEVYDLMNRVQELMVRSQAAPVRSACSSALLQFMLDYPLGEWEHVLVAAVIRPPQQSPPQLQPRQAQQEQP